MRRFLVFLLVFLLVAPVMVRAAAKPSTEELLRRIEELSKELESLKKQLSEVKEAQEERSEVAEEHEEFLEELKNNVGKFKIWGDIRTRMDSTRAYVPEYTNPLLSFPGAARAGGHHYENDTLYTNRMRLNLKVKPTEDTVVKMRLAYYKIWGMSNDYVAPGLFLGMGMQNNFTYGIRPADDNLYVDRAYFNWSNIGGLPVWVSFGRRPTTHGAPRQFREGLDKRDATPSGINFDVPFDGATIGYQYSWPWTGRIRICYGRGFESGFKTPIDRAKDDVDFYGFAWDVIDDPDRDMLLIVQAFKAEGVMDFPDGKIYMYNPAFNQWMEVYRTASTNLGDIYEIGATWQHKVDLPFFGLEGVDYFISAGLSITDPDEWSTMAMPTPNGMAYIHTSLLSGPYMTFSPTPPGDDDLDTKTGWAIWVGTRIPIPQLNSKLGLEYNYGSKWWMPFAMATDDPYIDKIATRGHVAEVYWIWDLPVGEALNEYAKAFLRIGYQYYWFNYTGSGSWLGKPMAIRSELNEEPYQMFTAPIDHMSNFYLSLELFF